MTDEEIAREVWSWGGCDWSLTDLSIRRALTQAAALGREEGRREAAEPKPEPVDEDTLAAREWRAQLAEKRGDRELAAEFRAGKLDTTPELQAYLAGLKAARAKLAPAGPDAAVLKARELCAALMRKFHLEVTADSFMTGNYDDFPELLAIAAAIREGV